MPHIAVPVHVRRSTAQDTGKGLGARSERVQSHGSGSLRGESAPDCVSLVDLTVGAERRLRSDERLVHLLSDGFLPW